MCDRIYLVVKNGQAKSYFITNEAIGYQQKRFQNVFMKVMLIYYLTRKSVNLKKLKNEIQRHSHSNIFFDNGLLTVFQWSSSCQKSVKDGNT